MVDPNESVAAGWIAKGLRGRGGRRRRKRRRRLHQLAIPLSEAPLNTDLVVEGIGDLPRRRQRHLLGYGLTPGSRVRALRHAPLTVVMVDQTELALERQLANAIFVYTSEDL
jgi:Fe2+ transport system protein FeoA